MNPLDAHNDEERFPLLLARYGEILSSGGDADPSLDPTLSAELRQRLLRALNCLRRLQRFRCPPPPSEAVTKVMKTEVTQHDDMVGRRLGRFRIVRTLGRGGGGIVFLALDPDLRREVAVKVPHMASLLMPDMRRRFLREARAAARLDHPNLVPIHEVGESGDMCFLVLAYCRGGSLAEWLRQRIAPVPIRQAAELLALLADAVHYVHERGIYHRDIKPGNILLEKTEERRGADLGFTPRLTDFGLAKQQDTDSGLTANGAVLGTPGYMAPEQLEGRLDDIGPPTDVYGLGAVLYELLTAQPPFGGANNLATRAQVLFEEPARPQRLRPAVPRDLEIVCLKCLEKEPRRRYARAAELAADLRRFLAYEPIQARPIGRMERLRGAIRRRPITTAVSALSLLLALVLVGGSLLLASRERAHEAELAAAAKQHAEHREDIRQKEQRLRQLHYADDIAQAWHSWTHELREDMANPLDKHRPFSHRNQAEDLRGFEWYFLSRLARAQPRVMRYAAGCYCLAFSPGGATCATGHYDGAIILWDVAGGRQSGILKKHKIEVTSLAYSPDGRYLVSGSAHSENGRFQGELLLWDVQMHEVIHLFATPSGTIDSVAFSPDGQTLATTINRGQDTKEVHLWAMPSGTLRRTIPFAGPRSATRAAFASDNRTLVVGCNDGKTVLCDSVTGQIHETRSVHPNCVMSVACGHKDAVFVSGGLDGRVRLSSSRPGGRVAAEYRHDDCVWNVALSPDDQYVASVSQGMLKVWDCVNQREHSSHTLQERGRSVAFSPDGKTLAVGGGHGKLWMYEVSCLQGSSLTGKDASPSAAALSWLGHSEGNEPREVWAVAFSPDDKILASAGDDHMIRLWDPATGREKAVLRGHQSLVTSLAFSPDGKMLASGSFDPQRPVTLWDAASGNEIATLNGHNNSVYSLAFSPNGRFLVTAGRDRVTRLWDVATRTHQPILSGPEIEALAFSPDGRTLALADHLRGVFLWDIREREFHPNLLPHPVYHVAVAFSPDSKTLVTGDSEGTLRFWNAATGELRQSTRRHSDAVNCLAFAPDGKTLASAGFDKRVKLWQTATGQEMLTLPQQKDRVRWLAFSADGAMLATAGHDGSIHIYRAGN